MVAIMAGPGYNQEDSLIFNKSAIDRGLFNVDFLRCYKDREDKNQAHLEEEKFCKPVKYNPNGTLRTSGMKGGSYDKLNEDGFVRIGEEVSEGDVLIGKVIPLKTWDLENQHLRIVVQQSEVEKLVLLIRFIHIKTVKDIKHLRLELGR